MVVVLGIAAVILAVAALFGPWWVFTSGNPGRIPLTTGFTPFGPTTNLQEICNQPNTYCTVIPERNATGGPYPPNTGGIFVVAATLTTLAALSGVGLVAACVASGSRPWVRRWGILFGIAAFILALAALVYVTIRLPGAMSQDAAPLTYPFSGFWGSTPLGGTGASTLTWGAGWAWYAVSAASLLFLIGSIALFRARGPSVIPTAPYTAQQP